MKIGPTARLFSVVAAVFLGVTGGQEWSSRSGGSYSWEGETSFAALALRAQGKLKIGLSIGFLALASAGVKAEAQGYKEGTSAADQAAKIIDEKRTGGGSYPWMK